MYTLLPSFAANIVLWYMAVMLYRVKSALGIFYSTPITYRISVVCT